MTTLEGALYIIFVIELCRFIFRRLGKNSLLAADLLRRIAPQKVLASLTERSHLLAVPHLDISTSAEERGEIGMNQERSFPVDNVNLWSGSQRIDERQHTVRVSRYLELNFAATVRNSGPFRVQMGKAHGVGLGLWGYPVVNAIVTIVRRLQSRPS
jgi:hypothetical protein